MKQALNKIFWGYILVLVEIHIVAIDILPDPVGYILIVSGATLLIQDFPVAKKARNLAVILIFVSLPTVIIQQHIDYFLLGQPSLFHGWSVYSTGLGLVKIILVFYIFQLLMSIVKTSGNQALLTRTSRTFKVYITIMLAGAITTPFSLNIAGDELIWLTVLSGIISFIMEIVFLVLLRSIRKHGDGSRTVRKW